MLVFAMALILLNPFLNPGGALFFTQIRMGRDCKPFRAYKFRSVRAVSQIDRGGAEDPLETDRISPPFGKLLRKTRIDELPQVLNVLRGDMSLIGPRPDYIHHARSYLRQIPEYRRRHDVRPGISGYSQVSLATPSAPRPRARRPVVMCITSKTQASRWICVLCLPRFAPW